MVTFGESLRLCAPPRMKLRKSHARTPVMKLADNLRLCELPLTRNVSGSVHPHNEACRQCQALRTPPHGTCGTPQSSVHPHDEFADSEHSTAENCGTSQAFYTPMVTCADSLRLRALSVHTTHDNCGTSQALCTPKMKSYDSLRL